MQIRIKKAQLGETMTWVVATLIIIFILSVSIFGASIVANFKNDPGSVFSVIPERTQDLIMENSLFTYFLIKDSFKQEKLETILRTQNEQGEFHENFDSKFTQLKYNLARK